MTPCPDNGQPHEERAHFNYRLSRARMAVENAFGRLNGRWTCLLKQNEASIQQINIVVSTRCILYDICENNKETSDIGPNTVECVLVGTNQENYENLIQQVIQKLERHRLDIALSTKYK